MTQNESNSDPNEWRDRPEEAPIAANTALVVDEVRIITSDPPRYELDIDGKVVTCSLADLVNRTAFQVRCLAVLHRIPSVPSGKGSPQAWERMVNGWLARAVRIETAEDASPVMFERAAVLACIEGLPAADVDDGLLQDFRRGCVVVRENRAALCMKAVLQRLRPDFPKMGPDDLAEHLRKLQWRPCRIRIEGAEGVRAWYAERGVWSAMPWAPQIDAEGRSA